VKVLPLGYVHPGQFLIACQSPSPEIRGKGSQSRGDLTSLGQADSSARGPGTCVSTFPVTGDLHTVLWSTCQGRWFLDVTLQGPCAGHSIPGHSCGLRLWGLCGDLASSGTTTSTASYRRQGVPLASRVCWARECSSYPPVTLTTRTWLCRGPNFPLAGVSFPPRKFSLREPLGLPSSLERGAVGPP
jgi:hypothetical protein